MSNMVQCPNCKQMVSKDNAFCIFCGANLPAEAPEPVPSVPDKPSALKRCRNGHEFEDADLLYCPVCGLPFDEKDAVPEHASSPAAPRSESRPAEKPETAIPEGMYVPTSEDLVPKRKAPKA